MDLSKYNYNLYNERLLNNNELLLYYFEYTNTKNTLYENEILIGTSTSTIQNNLYINMNVSIQNSQVIRQSELYFQNSINNVKHGIFTCILNTLNNSIGYTSRIGFFDDHTNKTAGNDVGGSGYFFVLIDGILNIGYRNGTTTNGTDILTAQNNFNILPLNLNHYDSYYWAQLHKYKIEYSSNGDVQFLIDINQTNEFILLHKIILSNTQIHNISKYNLPFRYSILKTGVQVNNASMFIYSTYIYISNNFSYSKPIYKNILEPPIYKLFIIPELVNRGYYSISSSDFVILFSLRLKSTNIRNIIKNISLYISTKALGTIFELAIVKNPTITGPTLIWTGVTSSSLEYSITIPTLDQNNLNIIEQQYLTLDTDQVLPYKLDICSNINGIANIYSIIARKLSNLNSNIIIGINWKE